jgi:hypothetical protein
LTGHVTETIENGKKKIEGMPHAKKELNPLWGLLAGLSSPLPIGKKKNLPTDVSPNPEPLFQILAAVGLLLSGVLGLVGKLVRNIPSH